MNEEQNSRAARPKMKSAPGDSFIQSLYADAERLRQRPTCPDGLVPAIGYWLGYPSFLKWIACTNWPAKPKASARAALQCAHTAATNALMHEAGRRGLDPAPLHTCGRVVEEIYLAQPDRAFIRGTYDTWPGCMGAWRYALPAGQQKALREGEAAFVRLVVAMGLDPEETKTEAIQSLPAPPLDWKWANLPQRLERLAKALIGRGGREVATCDLRSDIGEEPSKIVGDLKKRADWQKWIDRYIGHTHGKWWWKDNGGK